MQEQLNRYRRLLEGTALKLPDGGLQLRQKVRSLEASIAELGSQSAQPGPSRSTAILQDAELLGVTPKTGGDGRDGVGTSGGQAGPDSGGGRGAFAIGGAEIFGARMWDGGGGEDGTRASGGQANLDGGGSRSGAAFRGAGILEGGRSDSGSVHGQPPQTSQLPPEAVSKREGRPGEAPQLQHTMEAEPRVRDGIQNFGPRQGASSIQPGGRAHPSRPATADREGMSGQRDHEGLPEERADSGSSGRDGGRGAEVGPAKMPPHAPPMAQLATAMMTPFPDEQQAAPQVCSHSPI
jgi:hypothetical protein